MTSLQDKSPKTAYGFALMVGLILVINFSWVIGIGGGIALMFLARNQKQGMSFRERVRVTRVALVLGLAVGLPGEFFRHFNWREFKQGFIQGWHQG